MCLDVVLIHFFIFDKNHVNPTFFWLVWNLTGVAGMRCSHGTFPFNVKLSKCTWKLTTLEIEINALVSEIFSFFLSYTSLYLLVYFSRSQTGCSQPHTYWNHTIHYFFITLTQFGHVSLKVTWVLMYLIHYGSWVSNSAITINHNLLICYYM